MDDQSDSVQPDPRVNQMAGQLGKTAQSVNNMVFFARVVDLETEALDSDPPKPKAEDKHSPYPVVLVQIGGKEEKNHVRLWLPWLVNKAGAEAKSVKEIANAVVQAGENPTDYLLAVKYIDVLKDIMQMRNTRINLLPKKTAFLITSQALGMNTLLPKGGARAR